MPTVANIVLADAQATPVNHTFVPMGRDTQGVYWFEDQSGSSVIAYNRISVQLVRPGLAAAGQSSANRVNRVKISVHTPKVETLGTNDAGLTPPATIAYICRASVEFILPERSNLQDRKDLRKYVDNLLANADITVIVEQLLGYTG